MLGTKHWDQIVIAGDSVSMQWFDYLEQVLDAGSKQRLRRIIVKRPLASALTGLVEAMEGCQAAGKAAAAAGLLKQYDETA